MAEFIIEALGTLGHGIAKDKTGRPVYIPGTVPGERITATGEPPHLELDSILDPSPHRVDPPAPDLLETGIAPLQHMSLSAQRDWKRSEVERAFSKVGLKPAIHPTIGHEPQTRRRVVLTAWREGDAVQLGFRPQSSSERVAVEKCPILLPALEGAFESLRSLLATILQGRAEMRVHMTAAENGLDIAIETEASINEDMKAAMVRAFARSPFLRATANGELIAMREQPVVVFGGATVDLPPGAFLQAVKPAERAMVDLVTAHLAKSKRVIDLFSGLGTFAFPLSRKSKVHAVESDADAINALRYARREGGKAVTAEVRDLMELPLTASELASFDGICLDPPRAGAIEQIHEVAKTEVRRIAYVSCNPETQARDVAVLVKAGWTLGRITPIDQFVYSTHIESVALLEKKGAAKKRSIFR